MKFEKGKTCLVLDEIQECPEARTALKFIKISGKCDVIATGSLLGVSGYGEPTSIPVGYETIVDMKPMDFEEFLWANGINDKIIDEVCSCVKKNIPIPTPLYQRFRELLMQYIIVGGMPAVVDGFLQNRNLADVYQMQKDIVRSYEDDMVKHAPRSEKSVIKECFKSIPAQLSKENKKFQYSVIKKGSSASRYLGSLQWIEDAGIINRCYNLNITELPLEGNAQNDCFKVYMVDTGLFVSMLDPETQSEILQGNLLAYKGAIFENIMADFLSKSNKKLFYYHKDSGLEIDFVTQHHRECVLIEVKATSGNVKSSKTILAHPEKYHVNKVFKFGDYNVGQSANIITLPLYFAPFLFTRL